MKASDFKNRNDKKGNTLIWILSLSLIVMMTFFLVGNRPTHLEGNKAKAAGRASPAFIPMPTQGISQNPSTAQLQVDERPPAATEVTPEPGNSEQETSFHDLVPPSLTQIRQEVSANPHGVPESLLSFAASLGPRMEQALASEEHAIAFLDWLKKCAQDSNHPRTVRSVCQSNLELLAETYPNL